MKITRPLKLKNPIQQYAWGSHTAIQSLMREASTEAPWAELWMGDHPKGPSQVFFENRWIPLPDLIRRFPEQILGPAVMEKYPAALPYLFKVLAAEQPLSIQAHPARDQAKPVLKRKTKAARN
ncbi:MAG: type I phosphomannose isomerase catalytic subunit [Desulfobacterales bacterium]